jgi:hypothetical protein
MPAQKMKAETLLNRQMLDAVRELLGKKPLYRIDNKPDTLSWLLGGAGTYWLYRDRGKPRKDRNVQ